MNTNTTITNHKKLIGIAISVILVCFIVKSVIATIPWDTDEMIIYYVIIITTNLFISISALYVGFSPKIKSNLVAKVGAIFLSGILFFSTANIIYTHISGHSINVFNPIIFTIVYNLFYISAILLFFWGINIWLPSKLCISLRTIPITMTTIANCNWHNFIAQNLYDADYIYDIYISGFKTLLNLSAALELVISGAALALTIYWIMKNDRNEPTIINKPLNGSQGEVPKIIAKIPHKNL